MALTQSLPRRSSIGRHGHEAHRAPATFPGTFLATLETRTSSRVSRGVRDLRGVRIDEQPRPLTFAAARL